MNNRIMQLSRGLDPHNSSQNSDFKLNANRICDTQYNFHSSRTKLKFIKVRLCIFKWILCKKREFFDHKHNNLKNQIT